MDPQELLRLFRTWRRVKEMIHPVKVDRKAQSRGNRRSRTGSEKAVEMQWEVKVKAVGGQGQAVKRQWKCSGRSR